MRIPYCCCPELKFFARFLLHCSDPNTYAEGTFVPSPTGDQPTVDTDSPTVDGNPTPTGDTDQPTPEPTTFDPPVVVDQTPSPSPGTTGAIRINVLLL